MSIIHDRLKDDYSSNDKFLIRAKRAAVAAYNAEPTADAESLDMEDLYIVWFSKTLRNWKAMISTDRIPGIYFEVTDNGEIHNTYVDIYHKKRNHVLSYFEY